MTATIKFTDDREQITSLWSEVFGDSAEDIHFFLDRCKNKVCLGLFEDGRTLVSMLFLVDCAYCSMRGKYVYAVCTKENARKKGYASLLIEEAKKHMNDFLWLIPAKDYLFDFYSRLGFVTKLHSAGEYTNQIIFDETAEITEYFYEGSDYRLPSGMIYSLYDLPEGGTGYKLKEER